MFEFQEILVLMIVLAAAGYVGRAVFLKSRAFSPKSRCEVDCGCSDNSKTSHTAL
jgi:hypothetical protein